jgi:hypothetical protein
MPSPSLEGPACYGVLGFAVGSELHLLIRGSRYGDTRRHTILWLQASAVFPRRCPKQCSDAAEGFADMSRWAPTNYSVGTQCSTF